MLVKGATGLFDARTLLKPLPTYNLEEEISAKFSLEITCIRK